MIGAVFSLPIFSVVSKFHFFLSFSGATSQIWGHNSPPLPLGVNSHLAHHPPRHPAPPFAS